MIELMVVMAILAMMIGILLPAFRFARNAAKRHNARADISNLSSALKAFRMEYGYWPQTTSWAEMSTMLNANINPFTGLGAAVGSWASNNNPKAVQFMEFKTNLVSAAGEFIDPWGSPYIVMTDHGGTALGKATWSDISQPPPGGGSSGPEDGMVRMPSAASNIQAQVAIYSIGSDKIDQSGSTSTNDDIPSWME